MVNNLKKERKFRRILKRQCGIKYQRKKRLCSFAYRIISKALNLVPTDMSVENLKFKLDDNGKKATIDIKKLVLLIRSSKLHRCPNNTLSAKISGFADPRKKKSRY
jgi:hypothetical protein